MNIIKAIEQNNIKLAKKLVKVYGGISASKNTKSLNFQDVYGDTPLIWACMYGKIKIVKKLIVFSANVNLQDKNGFTALICACYKGNIEIVK